MKRFLFSILTTIAFLSVSAQGVPELMYYKFDGTAQAAVPNLASAAVGTNPAPFVGAGLSQGAGGQFGNALIGTGTSSTADYLNTNWNTSLTGSWTISFWCSNITSSATLYYIFGNSSTGFRCFTNGVAGANNWILRGNGITDVLVNGGAVTAPNVIHYVYDSSIPEIRAYLNGALVNTVPQAAITMNATDPFKVGAQGGSTGLSGNLDEFRMYNRALSPAEITSTWNQALPLVSGPKDMSVSNLISPATVNACVASALDTFSVNVFNFGSDTIFFNTDTVQVTGVTSGVNPQTYTAELNSGFMAPGSSMPVVLATNYDIGIPGVHVFDAYVEFLSGGPDVNLANDTMATATVLNPNVGVGLGQAYTEDFETFIAGSPGTFGSGWTATSPNNFAGWFVENDGVANSGSTGPINDHTVGGQTYMYTETSSGVTGDTYVLTSPCIDFTGATAPRLSFWYHMFGTAMGTLEVHVVTSGGFDSLVAGFIGPQQFAEGDPWLQSLSNLDWAIDSIVQLEFVGIRGTSFTSDMAIDDIQLFNAAPVDVSAQSIASPVDPKCFGSSEDVVVEIRNDGSLILDFANDNVTVDVDVTGANTSSGSVTLTSGTLAPLATQLVTISGIDLSINGINNIQAIASTPSDPNLFNDTTNSSIETVPTLTIPFTVDFETGFTKSPIFGQPDTYAPGWVRTAVSNTTGWQVEVDGVQNSFNTGPLDDHTPGGQTYVFFEANGSTASDTTILLSPCIDFTGVSNPRFSFWYHMFGTGTGSLIIHAVTSGGFDSLIYGLQGPQQFAEADPWLEAIANLDWAADSIIQLEIRAVSGTNTLGDIAIDDLNLYGAQPIDGLVSEILPFPSASCGFSSAELLSVVVKNLGFNTLDTIPMGYSINGGPTVVDTLFTSLVSTDTTLFTFNQPANLSTAGATYTIQAWTQITGDGTVANDTSTIVVTNPLSAVAPGQSYFEDFETFDPNAGFNGLANSWTSTTPNNFAGWNPEFDGVGNSGGTGPIDDHTPGGQVYMFTETSSGTTGDTYTLTSPCIDLSNATAPRLAFWYHMFGGQMGTLEAHIITQAGFDSTVATFTGAQQFSEGDPWKQSVSNLNFMIDSIVQIQFVGIRGTGFGSDMAIDDVNLFNAIPTDAQALGLVKPINSPGCFSGSDSLIVAVTNAGAATIDFVTDPMTVDVDVTGAGVVTYSTTINTDTLAVGDTLNVLVTAAANFGAPGTYNLSISNSIVADINTFNDSTNTSLISSPSLALPLIEDVETWTVGSPGVFGPGWTSTSPNNFAGWFVEQDGVFNSGSTGPLDDHTQGGTKYLYTETSSGSFGDTYELISPCIDFGSLGSPKLTFWYHMYGATMGTLSAIIRTDTGDAVVFSLSGQQQSGENDPWLQTPAIDLSGFSALGTGQLVFRGVRGTSFTGDMAIDDINLFEPSDFDVQAGGVVSPSDGCGFTNADTICAEIINFGLDTLDNIIASYSLNGGVYTTPETVPGILLPGDTMVYCFTTTADLSAFGAYDISVVTTQLVPADTVNFNDTSLTQVTHYTAYTGTFPYFQNFDGPGFVPNNTTFSPGAPVIALAEGWLNLQSDGPRDWVIRSAPTANAGTGPPADHTTGSTNYLYVEDSFQDDSVILISPCFDVSSLAKPKVEFWYHSNNGNNPNFEAFLHVDLIDGGVLIKDIIPPIGHKDNNWNKVEIDVSVYGTNWSMRFRGNSNNGSFLHDIAIDDFGIVDVIPQDAGMTAVLTPMSGCGLTANEDLTLAVANLGTDSILNGVTINYQIFLNGTPGAISSLPSPQDTILPGVILPVVIPGQNFGTPGTYTVVTWTSGLAGDTNGFNDTTSHDITHIPIVASYPYSEDFESGDGGWTVDDVQGSTWELATPANPTINSAASGVNSWITNATGVYVADEIGSVVSPCFDFSALTAPVIEFAIWWESEDPFDGAVLQSTIDGGTTWVTVGNFGDPNNWYTSGNIFGQPGGQGQGWTGDFGNGSGGWLIAEHDLDSLGGQSDVRLRIAFGSDGSIQRDGFAFDDIFIYDTPDTDVGVADILAPSGIDCSDDSTEVIVTLTNFGILPQTNIPVTINITGAATTTVMGTYTDTLAVGASTTFTVGTFNSNVGGTFNLSGYTVQAGDTLAFNDSTFAISVITTSLLAPMATGDSTCLDSTSFMLMASSSGVSPTHVWFDSFGQVVHIGDTFNTPVINQTTSYFVQAGSPPTVDSSLTTTFVGGNGQSGNMFDVEALVQDIEIDSFGVNLQTTGQVEVEVYYKSGTYVGSEGNAAAWTLLGSQTVTSAGTGNATIVELGGLVIPSGQIYGLYVTAVNGTVAYTNGANTYTNSDLEIEAGVGIAYPFGGVFNPRTWNGTLYYSSAGCPSPTVPVVAFFLPDVPVNLGPDGTACEGLILDAFLPQVSSYLWSNGDTTSTISVNATGTYYVDVVDQNGCSGSDSVNLFINPNPVVDLGADTVACDMITLDAGNPGGSYVWSIPGQFGQMVTINDTGTQVVYVEVTALGCSSSDTVSITISEAPVVDLGVDVTGCNPVPLDAGNPGLTYVWSTGDNTQTITATPPMMGSDTITVTVSNPSGCETTDEIILTAGTPPVVDLGPDGPGCDSVALDAGPGGAMYMWSTGEMTQTIVVNASGQYSVSVIDAAGCEGVDTVNLTIDLSPVANFTFNWVNYGFDFEFFDGSSNGTSVVWEFGDGDTSTDPNPTHTYQFSGSFEVKQIVTNDCGVDTFIQVVGPTDIEDELFGKSMSVYPNPSNGIFWVEGIDVQAEELTIEVLDTRGRLVVKHQHQFVINGFKQQVDLTNEAEGVYMVKITDGEHTTYKRVVRD